MALVHRVSIRLRNRGGGRDREYQKFGVLASGILGGAAGAAVMAIPALLWGLSTGRGVWYPVNLLAGMVVPGMDKVPAGVLQQFHAEWFVPALLIHAGMSLAFGLAYAAGAAPAAADFSSLRLGRPDAAAVVDGRQLRPHGSGQPGPPGGSAMALVHRLPVRFRHGGGQRRRSLGNDRHAPGRRRSGRADSYRSRTGEGATVKRSHPYTVGSSLFLLLLAFGAAGCGFTGKPDPAKRPVPPDRVMAFDSLYVRTAPAATAPTARWGRRRRLNDALFRAIVPVETVEEVVAAGRHGTLMPAFSKEHGGPLTPAQVAVLVNEIKGIPYKVIEESEDSGPIQVVRERQGHGAGVGSSGSRALGTPPYLAPKGRAGNAGAGRDRFRTACADCHGDHGQGVPRKDGGPTLAIHAPAFLDLISDQVLRRIVITGRADLGMPDYAHHGKEALTAEDVTNLVALLSYWRQGGTIGEDDPSPGKPSKSRGSP